MLNSFQHPLAANVRRGANAMLKQVQQDE